MSVSFTRVGTEFQLRSELILDKPIAEVFDFFAAAENLELLTPSWLSFNILTPQPIVMRVGLLIDYQIKLRFLPMRWRSEITVWEPGTRFVDEQRKGPYRQWIHEHTFIPMQEKTLVRDFVRYKVLGGMLVERLFVRPDLEKIFEFREKTLIERFGGRHG